MKVKEKYSVSIKEYKSVNEIMNSSPSYFVGSVFYTIEKPSYDIVLLSLSSIPIIECGLKNKIVKLNKPETLSIRKFKELDLPLLSKEEESVVERLVSFLANSSGILSYQIQKLISYLAIEKKFEKEFITAKINVFPELIKLETFESFHSELFNPDSQLRNRPKLAAVRVPEVREYLT